MRCRLIRDRGYSGAENMARDEALLAAADPAWDLTLRLYDWSPPAVSLGYFQDPLEVLDTGALKEEGFHWVRRETGGGAIFHHDEVTFSLSCPESPEILSYNREKSYGTVNAALTGALLQAGLTPALFAGERQKEKNRNNLCFLTSTAYDVLYDGRKIAGSAQRRKNGRVLHHGSLFLSRDATLYSKIFKWQGTDSLQNAVLSKTVTASEALGRSISFEQMSEHIIRGFEAVFAAGFVRGGFSGPEEEEASRSLEKYESAGWNAERRAI